MGDEPPHPWAGNFFLLVDSHQFLFILYLPPPRENCPMSSSCISSLLGRTFSFYKLLFEPPSPSYGEKNPPPFPYVVWNCSFRWRLSFENFFVFFLCFVFGHAFSFLTFFPNSPSPLNYGGFFSVAKKPPFLFPFLFPRSLGFGYFLFPFKLFLSFSYFRSALLQPKFVGLLSPPSPHTSQFCPGPDTLVSSFFSPPLVSLTPASLPHISLITNGF